MIVKWIPLLLTALLFTCKLGAQCTTLGQTPATAFPVCGVDTFSQADVPICTNNVIPTFCNDGVAYHDTNPFWYRFTCFQSGTLGFLITPTNLNDDYDWVLFDITNSDPSDVYNDSGLIVTYNWSGNSSLESARGYTGKTGTTLSSASTFVCATNPKELGQAGPYSDATTLNKMPNIVKGHTYLLMVSHFTQSQSGYKLSFGGGTASITDTTQPHLSSASVSCDASSVTVRLNKQMRCSSIAPDGSDFAISSGVTITGASGVNCSSSFDMNEVTLTLSGPLPAGNYTLTAKNGSDTNTLLDNCNTPIPAGENISFAFIPAQPTPLDSISPVGCSPDMLHLVFQKGIRCNSIEPGGSDFTVSGPSGVTITGAAGNCDNNGLSTVINLTLASPITVGGTYQIKLVPGTDGNTIIDECGISTPPFATLDFVASDTVTASYSYKILYGCKSDTVQYFQDGNHGINSWQWVFDSVGSALQNPSIIYPVFGDKNIQLTVSNGVCSDTASGIVTLDNTLKALFEATSILCPEDKAVFNDSSIGHIVSYDWDLGDGSFDFMPIPADHNYPPATATQKIYTVQLIVQDDLGCTDTATQQIMKLRSCYIRVPNAFTPNGDGINDYLYPLNAFKADNLEFRVYNRYGQLVFETSDWTKRWDGNLNGKPQGVGTYVWTLQYTDRDSGKKISSKGTTTLIR